MTTAAYLSRLGRTDDAPPSTTDPAAADPGRQKNRPAAEVGMGRRQIVAEGAR